jgi:hypothetical protein
VYRLGGRCRAIVKLWPSRTPVLASTKKRVLCRLARGVPDLHHLEYDHRRKPMSSGLPRRPTMATSTRANISPVGPPPAPEVTNERLVLSL